MVNLSLDGEVLSVVPDMKRPAAVAVFGDWAAIAEIEGHVSLLDKEGKTVKTLAHNSVKEQTATNKVAPADWRNGILTAPHGIDFDRAGNVFVTEFNMYGRVLKYDRRGNLRGKIGGNLSKPREGPVKASGRTVRLEASLGLF